MDRIVECYMTPSSPWTYLGHARFGAPTYVLRDEPFRGQDRLEFVERALAHG